MIKTLKAKNKTGFLIKRILPVFYLKNFTGFLPYINTGSDFRPKNSFKSVDQAHSVLWNKFVDKYGIKHDYVGELPNPEDCELGLPNAIGWWSPIENGPMFTGIYLWLSVNGCVAPMNRGTSRLFIFLNPPIPLYIV